MSARTAGPAGEPRRDAGPDGGPRRGTARPSRTRRGAPPHPLLRRIALHAAALAALLGVFALYAQPDFLVTLADRVWACF